MRQWKQKPPLGAKVNFANPISKGLIYCGLFNEGAGNKVFDLSGNQNTGTITNAIWVSGKFGSCLSFDGNGDYVQIPHSSPLDNMQNISFGCWSYTSLITVENFLMEKDSNIYGIHLYNFAGVAATLGCLIATDNNTWASHTGKSGGVPYNAWVHLFCTYDGSKIRGYVNGVEQTLTNNSITGDVKTDSGGNLYLATWEYLDYCYDGEIDNIMIYNRALSAAEVLQLYREPFCLFNKTLPIGISYMNPNMLGTNF